MLEQVQVRAASAVTLLSLAIFAGAELAAAQAASAPFGRQAPQLSVPLISPQEMTPTDRAAAQSWQPAIVSSAQFYGYTVDSSYRYREIACPVAPQHLLLAYEATTPNGSVSRFTAVIRRQTEEETAGRHAVAQIIPILHFGVVPFIPAIANPHSIEVFNAAISPAPGATEVLAADQAGNQPLLVRALCYLAMVGEEPVALSSPPSSRATVHAPVPTLVFQNRGKIRQLVSIRSSQNSYEVWALTFQAGGNLLAATRQEHPIDRTPLVLDAANTGSPATYGDSGVAAATPMAIAATAAPNVAPPAAVNAAAAEPPPRAAPSLPATPSSAAKVEPLQPVPPAETKLPIAEPVSAPLAASGASTVEPVAPAPPVMVAPPPPPAPAPATSTLEPAAATSTPQPPVPPMAAPATAASATAGIAEPAAISAPHAPSIALVATPPVVKPSPPSPPGRFIPNPPQPPSRFIPDSALKTPPHLSP